METATVKSGKQIKELIIINNDRYEGYKTAAKETKDADLKAIFTSYSQQSKQFSDELQGIMPEQEESPEPGETKNTGKLYRVFMDIKNTLNGKDRKGILSSCEFGEDEIKRTYDEVLEDTEAIDNDSLRIIERQRSELQKSHDRIKAMRDSA